MKIAICTLGSRGDVQPFLILGKYLQENGHQVKVSSAEMYQPLAATYGVQFESFIGDYASIINDESFKKEIGKNPFTISQSLKEKVYPVIENALEIFYKMANWADIVLYHPKTMLDGIGATFQHKLIKSYVVPAFTSTKAFSNPMLSCFPLPKCLNPCSYHFSNFLMQWFNKPIKKIRYKYKLKQKKYSLDTPIIYGISPSFIEKPKDYPQNAYFSGFWIEERNYLKLPDDLVSFLSGNKKTLLITFGSMPYKSDIDINDFIKGIKDNLSLKILIVRGWGLRDVRIIENKEVMAIHTAPFDLLCPKVNFILHHGGAGTTAIALKSGLPQMITPILYPFGDQYFWGKQIEKKRLGVRPIPLKRLSIECLISSIKKLILENWTIQTEFLKDSINRENGLSKAKEIIEEHYKKIYTHKERN